MKIYVCDAPAGSGKTFQLAHSAVKCVAQGKPVILCQPTIELLKETERQFGALGLDYPVHRFDSEKFDNVQRELSSFLIRKGRRPSVVLITHATACRIPVDPMRWNTALFLDETPEATRCLPQNFPATHEFFTRLIRAEPEGPIYARVHPVDDDLLLEIARNEVADQGYRPLQDVASSIIADHWDVFVNQESYQRLLDGPGKAFQLNFLSTLNPSWLEGYGSVTLAAADASQSLFVKILREQGVSFRPSPIQKRLRNTSHKNGPQVSIQYLFEGTWSKTRQATKIGEHTHLEWAIMAATREFGDQPFLFMANKSLRENPFRPEAIRLPNVPFGFNQFSHVHDVVVLSAANPLPQHTKFLSTQFGISGDEVRTAIHHQVVYQAIMRTSIRNPDDLTPKRIIVPDRDTAEFLAGKFPGCRLERLDIGQPEEELVAKASAGRPRKHVSDGDRNKAYRDRLKQDRLQVLKDAVTLNERSSEPNRGDDITLYDKVNFVTEVYRGTVFPNKHSGLPMAYLGYSDDHEYFCLLECLHKRTIAAKDDNFLISPAVFDTSLSTETDRGLANVRYLSMVMLDFEEGDLLPTEVPALFPGLKMAITNSYRHDPNAPRYRVFIPLDQLVTADLYHEVWDGIRFKLIDAGYSVGKQRSKAGKAMSRSGLDTTKRAAASLFYAPSQAENPRHSFFEVYEKDRSALNVQDWVGNMPIPSEQKVPNWPKSGIIVPRREDAIAEARRAWRAALPGEGNQAFFALAKKLLKAGVDREQLQQALEEESQFGRSAVERKKQIPSIFKSLDKSGRN